MPPKLAILNSGHRQRDVRCLLSNSIDRFKKFARLGTSLLISDAITSISATMRGKHTSDDLAKSTYRFIKMQTRIMQTQQLLGFSRFSSQHLEESWSDVLGRKKSKWVEHLYSQEESSVSFWAALIETHNRLSDLLPRAETTSLQGHSTPFFF